jgi:hypothetical protein
MIPLSLGEIAEVIGGKVEGDNSVTVSSFQHHAEAW